MMQMSTAGCTSMVAVGWVIGSAGPFGAKGG